MLGVGNYELDNEKKKLNAFEINQPFFPTNGFQIKKFSCLKEPLRMSKAENHRN